jgi:hypothetical protein
MKKARKRNPAATEALLAKMVRVGPSSDEKYRTAPIPSRAATG